jgi:hypothetical protein
MYSAGLLPILGRVLQEYPAYSDQYITHETAVGCRALSDMADMKWMDTQEMSLRSKEMEREYSIPASFPSMNSAESYKDVPVENDEKGLLSKVLKQHKSVFNGDLSQPAKIDPLPLKLKPGGKWPKRAMPRRVPPAYHREAMKLREEMMRAGVIRTHMGPVASAVHLAPKPGHTKENPVLRFCVDFRQINKELQDLALPLPRIDDMLHKLQQSKYFVTLDLKSGFHQVPVKRSDQFILAFVMEDERTLSLALRLALKQYLGIFKTS